MNTISTKKWGYMIAALAAGVAFCPAQAAHDPEEEASEGIHATFKRLVDKVGITRAQEMVSEWHDRFKEADPKTKAAIKIAAGIGITALTIAGLIGTHAAVRTWQEKGKWGDYKGPGATISNYRYPTWGEAWQKRRGLVQDLRAAADWFQRPEPDEPPGGKIGGQAAVGSGVGGERETRDPLSFKPGSIDYID